MHADKLPPNQSTIHERTRAMPTDRRLDCLLLLFLRSRFALPCCATVRRIHRGPGANNQLTHSPRPINPMYTHTERCRVPAAASGPGGWQVGALEPLGLRLQLRESPLQGLVLVHQIADCRLELARLLLVPRRHLDNALAQLLLPARIATRSIRISMEGSFTWR